VDNKDLSLNQRTTLSKIIRMASTDNEPHHLQIARRAFQEFQHGLNTNDWRGILDLFSDDIELWIPKGSLQGLRKGRNMAEGYFNDSGAIFKNVQMTLKSIVSSINDQQQLASESSPIDNDGLPPIVLPKNTVALEFVTEGLLRDKMYKNFVCLVLDIQGDKITSYREYLCGDGTVTTISNNNQ